MTLIDLSLVIATPSVDVANIDQCKHPVLLVANNVCDKRTTECLTHLTLEYCDMHIIEYIVHVAVFDKIHVQYCITVLYGITE